jgi:hypothetical protein
MRPYSRFAVASLSLAAVACIPEARVAELSSANFEKLKGFADVRGIRIDNTTGGVKISSGGVDLDATMTLFGADTEAQVTVVDDVVVFETECGGGVCIVDYDIRVPRGWSVTVDNGSGWVDVDSLEPTFLFVDTGSGTIAVDDVAAGSVSLDTGSGAITIADLTADTIDLDSGSGGISATALRSLDLVVSTGSGAVTLAILTPPDRLVVGTGSGGVHVSLPRGAYDMTLSTGSGGINVDELEDDPESEQKVDISTGSGGIQIGPS